MENHNFNKKRTSIGEIVGQYSTLNREGIWRENKHYQNELHLTNKTQYLLDDQLEKTKKDNDRLRQLDNGNWDELYQPEVSENLIDQYELMDYETAYGIEEKNESWVCYKNSRQKILNFLKTFGQFKFGIGDRLDGESVNESFEQNYVLGEEIFKKAAPYYVSSKRRTVYFVGSVYWQFRKLLLEEITLPISTNSVATELEYYRYPRTLFLTNLVFTPFEIQMFFASNNQMNLSLGVYEMRDWVHTKRYFFLKNKKNIDSLLGDYIMEDRLNGIFDSTVKRKITESIMTILKDFFYEIPQIDMKFIDAFICL